MRGQRSGSNLEKTLRLKNKQFCTSRNALIFASFCFTPYSSPCLPLVRHKLHVWEPTVLALVEKSWIGQGRRDQFSSSSRSIQQHNKVFSFCSIHRLLSCKSTVRKIIFLKMAAVLIRCPSYHPHLLAWMLYLWGMGTASSSVFWNYVATFVFYSNINSKK